MTRERHERRARESQTGLGRHERHQARSELADAAFNDDGGIPLQPLVRTDTFIRATRDAGYRSTAMAIAELIDNSVQAKASRIDIIVERDGEADGLRVAVVDDGEGMDAPTLAEALRFGGSTRFDSRDGQGRFGMGLPNASVSQARRVDVFTWTDPRFPITTMLDADVLSTACASGIPHPTPAMLPAWVRPYVGGSGTAVVWTRCDRIHFRRVGMLTRHLHRELGRVFRRFLSRGLILRINRDDVSLNDPVRVVPRPPTGHKVIEFPPIIFPFADPTRAGHTSIIEVRFTLLPVVNWTELPVEMKRSFGIAGGATVSVLRADREIALGWHLLGTKKRENYDDWWRCEVSFQPPLDELFGVTHSKQGIRPTAVLQDALVPSLEAQARRLNRVVREEFDGLKSMRSDATRLAEELHHKVVLSDNQIATRVKRHARVAIAETRYRLTQAASASAHFADVRTTAGVIELVLNTHHPFYRAVYEPLRREVSPAVARAFDVWLLAFARALSESPDNSRHLLRSTFLKNWSDAAALLLEGR